MYVCMYVRVCIYIYLYIYIYIPSTNSSESMPCRLSKRCTAASCQRRRRRAFKYLRKRGPSMNSHL